MHDFPAGRLAAWSTAWLTGRTSYDEALDAVTGDTAHRVSGLPGTDGAVPLGEALGPEAIAWTAFDLTGAEPAAPPVEGTLRSVSGQLDLAVADAARTLVALDLARWNPEVPALLADLAKTTRAPGLPADHEPLALSVLGRAQRLAQVLDLAMADAPGAAVTTAQAAARDDALRPLATAVREAAMAAYNWVPRN